MSKDVKNSFEPTRSGDLLRDLKLLIDQGRNQAVAAVNSAITITYWHVGKRINEEVLHGERAEYGKHIVASLAKELVANYGKSFELKNLRRMMQFAEVFPDVEIVVPLARQLDGVAVQKIVGRETAQCLDRGARATRRTETARRWGMTIIFNHEIREKREMVFDGANNVLEYIDDYIFNEKILCIAEDGGRWGANEVCAKIYSEKCWVNNHAHVLTARRGAILEYLSAYLNYANLNPYITGTTRGKLTRKKLDSISIPLPPLDDQKRIAHLLGKVEGLIARRKQHLQQLDDLLKSVFLEMFGDPVRNEKGWDEREIGKSIKIKHGFAFKSEYFSDEGPYVLLTAGNFFETGGFRDRGDKQKYYTGETPEEYILEEGSLLLAMTEQAPGLLSSPLIVPESNLYLHNQRLGLAVAQEPIQSRFLFHLFNQKAIRQIIHSKATGTKVRHTSPTKLESIVVGYPPIDLQNQFATIVEKVESLKSRYQQSLTDLESLYGALSQKAFKGELDLSRVVLPDESTREDTENLNHKILKERQTTTRTSGVVV